MAHTLPDYTTKYKMTTIFGNIDDAELAARLGSINSYDRRGNVVWMDDFEGATLRWKTTTGGVGPSISLSATWPKSGSASAKLTAGSGPGGIAVLEKYLPYPVLSKMGLEVSFTCNDNIDRFGITLSRFTGTKGYMGELIYYTAQDKLKYYNSAGGYTDLITNIALETTNEMYHVLKLVIDFTTDEYERVILNNNTPAIDGTSIRSWDTVTDVMLRMQISNVSTDAAAQPIYVDNVILTQNEP